MRGRTLKNCFAILDEAQNATSMQIKMSNKPFSSQLLRHHTLDHQGVLDAKTPSYSV